MAESASPHYINPNDYSIESIRLIVSSIPSLQGYSVSFQEIETGWNNRPLILHLKSSQSDLKLLLKLINPKWPAEKVLNELGGMEYIRNNFTHELIPIPLIYGYGLCECEKDSLKGYKQHWIMMEYIEGDCLETIWVSLSPSEKQELLKQIGSCLNLIQSTRFNTIGGWTITDKQAGHAKYFDGGYQVEKETDLIMLKYEQCLRALLKLPGTSELAALVEGCSVKVREFASQIKELLPITFFHGDFNMRNMIVRKETTEGKVSWKLKALLDWEWSGSFPISKEWEDMEFEGEDKLFLRKACNQEDIVEDKNRTRIWNFLSCLETWRMDLKGIQGFNALVKEAVEEFMA